GAAVPAAHGGRAQVRQESLRGEGARQRGKKRSRATGPPVARDGTLRSRDPMRGYRVWAEIDLAALRHNIGLIRRALEPATKIMAVTKADAYGHGALPIAWTALEAGCAMVGVGDSG